jgi:hypothetical protein
LSLSGLTYIFLSESTPAAYNYFHDSLKHSQAASAGAETMIAQTMVEYGALQSISASLMNAFHRVEVFFAAGSSRYFLFLGLAFIVVLIWTRRRAD